MSRPRPLALKVLAGSAGLLALSMLAGCASDGSAGGGSLPAGSSCGSIRSELRSLDNRGVPAKVEAVNAGRRVSAKDREQAKHYNDLLNQYLGARCHIG